MNSFTFSLVLQGKLSRETAGIVLDLFECKHTICTQFLPKVYEVWKLKEIKTSKEKRQKI